MVNLECYSEKTQIEKVTVTCFNCTPSQTDKSPDRTACNFKINKSHDKKIIALSRDLSRKYKFGDKFYLCYEDECLDVVFQDNMNKKHRKKVDLYMNKGCKEFGVKQGILIKRKL